MVLLVYVNGLHTMITHHNLKEGATYALAPKIGVNEKHFKVAFACTGEADDFGVDFGDDEIYVWEIVRREALLDGVAMLVFEEIMRRVDRGAPHLDEARELLGAAAFSDVDMAHVH